MPMHFHSWIVLLLNLHSSSYILGINALSQAVCKYFVRCFFILLNASFAVKKLLMWENLTWIVLFYSLWFYSLSHKIVAYTNVLNCFPHVLVVNIFWMQVPYCIYNVQMPSFLEYSITCLMVFLVAQNTLDF